MSYVVGVRALCEFAARSGDLDLRFAPSPTGQQGVAGHRAVMARRGASYETEIALTRDHKTLTVRGRADGFDAAEQRLEEIKTYRGRLDAISPSQRQLHRAQAWIYGALLCAERGLPALTIAMIYYNVDTQVESTFQEYMPAAELQQFFERQCERFIDWAAAELVHRAARDAALAALAFPHAEFRPGQRHLAEYVYKAVCTAQPLLAQAPTGIGKTLATLFPALKAIPAQHIDKLFFLSAKTPGRALALQALRTLHRANAALPLRVLELTARDKSCVHPDKACHGDSCPLAAGFHDRLPAARSAAIRHDWWDRGRVETIAAQHAVCPYYLAQELARWSDVVVADYHYFFDAGALLFGLLQSNEWRATLLVDEAHSLVERARAMYSAELDQDDFVALRRSTPPELMAAFDDLEHAWEQLAATQETSHAVHAEPPPLFMQALRTVVAAIGDFAARNPRDIDAALLAFYFDILRFCRIADAFDEHSLCDGTRRCAGGQYRLQLALRNVVPAKFLRHRFAALQSAVLFSATLDPAEFYLKMLGLPERTPSIDVESPFDTDQLIIHIAEIATGFRRRNLSVAPIAGLIESQFRSQPGNYLAFFSSFDYLEQVATSFRQKAPDIDTWQQQRGMDERDRGEFIDRFTEAGSGVGFAVLGGAFGEGIDLPGRRLIGAFVVTLGLPQTNPVNEQMMQRIGALFGVDRAWDYTYLIPGLRKVIQAAGRIIRTGDDMGTLFLVDERFRQPRIQRLLPAWWQLPARRPTTDRDARG